MNRTFPACLRIFPLLVVFGSSGLAHAQQVGVLDNGSFYSVNPNLKPGTSLQILPDDDNGQPRCCATIAAPAQKSDGPLYDNLRSRDVLRYKVSLPPSIPDDTQGFGVAGPVKFIQQGKYPVAVLDEGLQLAFATCTSMEGTHYLGRKPGNKKLLVHMYQYFDGDLEPDCPEDVLKASHPN